jgi:hypothetical protein
MDASSGSRCNGSSGAGFLLAHICHPYPSRRLRVITVRQEPDAGTRPSGSVRGDGVSRIPTAAPLQPLRSSEPDTGNVCGRILSFLHSPSRHEQNAFSRKAIHG